MVKYEWNVSCHQLAPFGEVPRWETEFLDSILLMFCLLIPFKCNIDLKSVPEEK